MNAKKKAKKPTKLHINVDAMLTAYSALGPWTFDLPNPSELARAILDAQSDGVALFLLRHCDDAIEYENSISGASEEADAERTMAKVQSCVFFKMIIARLRELGAL